MLRTSRPRFLGGGTDELCGQPTTDCGKCQGKMPANFTPSRRIRRGLRAGLAGTAPLVGHRGGGRCQHLAGLAWARGGNPC
jgi:hypothetical protein